MKPSEVEAFKSRVGWDSMPPPDLSGGVCADWSSLAAAIQPAVGGLRKYSESAVFVEPGLMQLRLTWQREPKALGVDAYISMDPMHVRNTLISRVSHTMMMTIPYVRGPKDLGEISIRNTTPPGDTLMWVFHNVLVRVDNDGTGFDIIPAAYATQAFINRYLTPVLAAAAPKMDRVYLTPSTIHVGDEVRVGVTLEPGAGPDFMARIFEWPASLLRLQGADGLSSTFLAKSPGKTRIDITLIDKNTLLPPTRGVSLEVLP